ncbi:MAG: DUF1573 domain-containing protein [Proteobacteria bacterium]|nr:DUF1573 domain-containing protein [Pseudomonadota bacterium]
MKLKSLLVLFFILFFTMFVLAKAEEIQAVTNASLAPSAVLEDNGFRFDRVLESAVVTHDFIIKNTGNAPLSINKVKTSCGCTTVDYTRQILPGAEGKISIRVNTAGYAGRNFKKSIIVYTDDPKHQIINLFIKGEVEAFALIAPKIVFLSGNSDRTIQSRITITPLEKYPFNIVESYAVNLDKKIVFALNKKEDKYFLTVKNIEEKTGKYQGSIYLKTDNKLRDEIVINVIGIIR